MFFNGSVQIIKIQTTNSRKYKRLKHNKRKLGFIAGPSGIGKGYGVGDVLDEYHGTKRFITGDWCRENASQFSNGGTLAPDEIIFRAVEKDFRSSTEVHYFIDAPRSVGQVNLFMQMFLDHCPAAEIHTIHIDGDRRICEQRLIERAKRQGRLDDANPEVIKRRLDAYYHRGGIGETVVPFVQNRTNYIRINGNYGMEQIRGHVLTHVCPRIFSPAHRGHRVPL